MHASLIDVGCPLYGGLTVFRVHQGGWAVKVLFARMATLAQNSRPQPQISSPLLFHSSGYPLYYPVAPLSSFASVASPNSPKCPLVKNLMVPALPLHGFASPPFLPHHYPPPASQRPKHQLPCYLPPLGNAAEKWPQQFLGGRGGTTRT